MSARNGDKSRHQINRKRAVVRRAKIRDLVKAAKDGAGTPPKVEPVTQPRE
ncbi:MAG: hypothetical protein M3545_10405 [Acidobacteriota bacterium]|nr:hypothetical protein [Acidobacteriota bacterium]